MVTRPRDMLAPLQSTGVRHCLYETALREAIARQHGLRHAERAELRACAGCGKPFLLESVRLPYPEPGELACPRCGSIVASWDATANGFLAYWH